MKHSSTFLDYESAPFPKKISGKMVSDTPKLTSTAKSVRKRWDPRQKSLVLESFQIQIKNRKYPTKDSIVKFIKKHTSVFSNNDYKRIRTLIVNSYTFPK